MNKFKLNKETGEYEDAGPQISWRAPELAKAKIAVPKAVRTRRVKVPVLCLEKQRRSRVDWDALLPNDIAVQQIAYERRATVVAMRKSGMTLKAIGEQFGLTPERIRQMYERQLRTNKHGLRSPADKYLETSERPDFTGDRARRLAISAREMANGKSRDWLYV